MSAYNGVCTEAGTIGDERESTPIYRQVNSKPIYRMIGMTPAWWPLTRCARCVWYLYWPQPPPGLPQPYPLTSLSYPEHSPPTAGICRQMAYHWWNGKLSLTGQIHIGFLFSVCNEAEGGQWRSMWPQRLIVRWGRGSMNTCTLSPTPIPVPGRWWGVLGTDTQLTDPPSCCIQLSLTGFFLIPLSESGSGVYTRVCGGRKQARLDIACHPNTSCWA